MPENAIEEEGTMPAEQLIGANIARLRNDRGMTQEELAESADLSRVSLGKIERGTTVPRASTLDEIARGLGVPLSELVTSVRPLHGVRFRAKKRVNTREQILAEVSSWLHDYRWLEDQLDEERDFELSDFLGSEQSPEELAAAVRKELRLEEKEPIHDICGLLESSGVKVRQINRSTNSFFGLSVSPGGGGPAIVVNTWERISVERWIFTAAHELGHILMHGSAYDRQSDDEDMAEEQDADLFAGHFLLPEEGFTSEWNETAGRPFLDRVLKVKRIFHVSYKTLLYRLVHTGRENNRVWGKFQKMHRKRFGSTLPHAKEPEGISPHQFDWNRAGEPDRLSKFDFGQDRLSLLVKSAYEREIVSLGRAAEILGISRSDMRELADEWAT